MDSFTSEDDCLIHRVNVWENQWDVHKQHFLAGRQSDVHCKLSWKHLKDCPLSQTRGWLKVNLASRSRLFLSRYVFLIRLRRRSRWCQAQTKEERSAHAYKLRGMNMHILTAPTLHPPSPTFPRQLLLKRVLYLSWQQWSHSPGLIYLKGRIMNSLWHLISPSLLIWLSAGICMAICTTGPLDCRLELLDIYRRKNL